MLKKVRVALGLERCEVLLTGAAPIHRDVVEYFMSVNMPVLESYGMSESAGPQNGNNMSHWRPGSVGPVMAGCRTKIYNPDENGDGEVCVCCKCVRVAMVVDGWWSDVFRNHQKQDLRMAFVGEQGGKVRGWAKLCTCLMGNVWLITWRSFANRALSLRNGCYSICLVRQFQ